MKLYKITDVSGFSRFDTWWGAGVTNTAASEAGTRLCTDEVVHAYETRELAVLLYPYHTAIRNPLLWEAEGDVVARDGVLKAGCKSLTTTRQIPMPKPTPEQLLAIGERAWEACPGAGYWSPVRERCLTSLAYAENYYRNRGLGWYWGLQQVVARILVTAAAVTDVAVVVSLVLEKERA